MAARLACATAVLLAGFAVGVPGMAPSCLGAGDQAATEVLKWKDGKKAAFMLAFDDSCVSHIKNAIPEMKKRGLIGTFYINPGNGPFMSQKDQWEKEIPAMGVEYGNHTFTHAGALSVAEFEKELEKSNELINKCFPGRKQPRLIAFGRPGVPKEKWCITDDEYRKALARFNLVERPNFYGPPIHLKTTAEILKVVDTAIENGEMGHLDFHGVGGDWLVTPMDSFVALLDKLDACRDQIWVTDLISWHKYMTERSSAEVKALESGKKQVRLQLTCKSDPAFYDMPLTLSTAVPAGWKECLIVQGTAKTSAPVSGGKVCYQAVPNAGEILIKPGK